jgi:hypothetical protein
MSELNRVAAKIIQLDRGALAPETDPAEDYILASPIWNLTNPLLIERKPIEWAAGNGPEGIIAMGHLHVFAGKPGNGKSSVLTCIASAVARGVPFAGMSTTRRPVLILDRENSDYVYGDRCERLGIPPQSGVHIWGMWQRGQDGGYHEAPMADDPAVIRWVEMCNPKPLVIVDGFTSFYGGNENDATETRAFMKRFHQLTKRGAAVVVIHHSGKAETAQKYRGSSDIEAVIDIGYLVKNLSPDTNVLTTIALDPFKARFSVDKSILLDYRDGGFTRNGNCANPAFRNHDMMTRLLYNNPGVTQSELVKLGQDAGLTKRAATDWITLHRGQGYILETPKKPRGNALHLSPEAEANAII